MFEKKLVLKIESLKKNFGDLEVLRGISEDIESGQVTMLIGPSGSGKSTFLRCLNLIERANSGKILLDGIDILQEKKTSWIYKKVGMVFQNFNLFPNKNVLENLILAPVLNGVSSKEEAIFFARSILTRFDIISKEKEYPENLSGGQSQRVAIARALCMKPEIILFDEPTSALDPEMVKEVLDVIRELRKDNMTMIIASHLMSFAKEISDKIIFMDKGLVIEKGGPNFFENPKEDRTKEFLSKII